MKKSVTLFVTMVLVLPNVSYSEDMSKKQADALMTLGQLQARRPDLKDAVLMVDRKNCEKDKVWIYSSRRYTGTKEICPVIADTQEKICTFKPVKKDVYYKSKGLEDQQVKVTTVTFEVPKQEWVPDTKQVLVYQKREEKPVEPRSPEYETKYFFNTNKR